MSVRSPDALPRAFAAAWAARDADEIAALFAEDADLLSLTGHWAEGRKAIAETFAGELAGAFLRAKLVTGRVKERALGPDTAVVIQRFVLSGILRPDGSDAGRVSAVLAATLSMSKDGWQIACAQFAAEG
jgi:uncharacterized protein (TIGR02246 family)